MRYELRLTAFDMLDKIHIVFTMVDSGDGVEVTHTVVLQRVTTVPGEGESDPSSWARDALVAALETL
jgi:hypothetical protein